MTASRYLIALAAICMCGITYAALSPALPWQEDGMPKPSEEHKMVMEGLGEYTGTITIHNMGPEPVASPCTETVQGVGQFWTQSRFETEFMGKAFSGSSTFGYDPDKKKYIGTWVDSMTPSLTFMEGEYDETKKAIVMNYENKDPMSGKMVKMRSENSKTENGFHMKFFVVGEEELLQMEIEMQRK